MTISLEATIYNLILQYIAHHWSGHPFNSLFQDNLANPATEKIILDFNEEKDDEGDTLASAGPHANNVHFAPDR